MLIQCLADSEDQFICHFYWQIIIGKWHNNRAISISSFWLDFFLKNYSNIRLKGAVFNWWNKQSKWQRGSSFFPKYNLRLRPFETDMFMCDYTVQYLHCIRIFMIWAVVPFKVLVWSIHHLVHVCFRVDFHAPLLLVTIQNFDLVPQALVWKLLILDHKFPKVGFIIF